MRSNTVSYTGRASASSASRAATLQKSDSMVRDDYSQTRNLSIDTPDLSTAPAEESPLLALARNKETALAGSPLTKIVLDAGSQKDPSNFSGEEGESSSSTEDENSIQNNIFITP